MMSVSLDQALIKELSNFAAFAFEAFLLAVDGLLLAKTTVDVGPRMANTGVENFIVRDMIRTISEDLGFTYQHLLQVLATYAVCTNKSFKIKVIGSRASVMFTCNAKFADRDQEQDPMVEELCRRIKEPEAKLGEQDKENVRPKLSEEAVDTLLAEEGVPKWVENLEGREGMKPIQFLSNEVWYTMWDTKESYATKYHHKTKERYCNGKPNPQSQESWPGKKHNLSVDLLLDRGGKKYRVKTKAGYFWFMDF